MKKSFPVFFALLILLTACSLGGGGDQEAQPTAMTFATAAPTVTPIVVNPTPEPQNQTANAGDERVYPLDGMTQVYIPAGSFRMGGLDEGGAPDEEPDRQVTMTRGYWIDKVEVTNGMYLRCVQAGACNPPRTFASSSRPSYFNNPQFDNYPVIGVTWDDAAAYCAWAGRRLPTEAEWEYAARGTDFRIYPWGSDHPTAQHANFNFLVRDTMPVGSYPLGASPWGVLDMAGNVWEWVQDYYVQNFYEIAGNQDPLGPLAPASAQAGELRVVRGGSWQDPREELRVSNRGFSAAPDHNAQPGSERYLGEANQKTGFRCVSDN